MKAPDEGTSSSQLPDWWSSWHDAHLRTCQKRRSLVATPQQVLDYTNANTNSDDSDVIFWTLPERSNAIEWDFSSSKNTDNSQLIQEATSRFGNQTMSTPTKNKPPSPAYESKNGFLQSLTKTITATLTPIVSALTPDTKSSSPPIHLQGEEDDALRSWNSSMDETDASSSNQHTTNNAAGLVMDWNQPILNSSLTRQCFEILQKELQSPTNNDSTSSSSGFPRVISRRRNANNSDMSSASRGDGSSCSATCWTEWLRQIDLTTQHDAFSSTFTIPNDWLSRISETEADFLLGCMAHMGYVTLIPSDPTTGIPKEDLVVLGEGGLVCSSSSPLNQEEGTSRMYQQVLASWWELTMAQESLERRRRQWSHQAQEWCQKARKERSQGSNGLASFKIHKLFLQRLEQSGGMLLNLEQARHALEESWHQRQVVQALETSTRTLQSLRQDTDEINNVMESYRDEVEHVGRVQESLSAGILDSGNHIDEDDLMKELELLTLQDRQEPSTSQQESITPPPPPSKTHTEKENEKEKLKEESKVEKDANVSSASNSVPEQTKRVLLPG